jgi:xanthine dehydrogenase accessory factor
MDELLRYWQAGLSVGLASVVSTWDSAPRPAGAVMLVDPNGAAAGSVSGGCVEAAVYDLARDVIETGTPTLTRYGSDPDQLFGVGLTCGGMLDVYVERIDQTTFPELAEVAASIAAHQPVAVVTCVSCSPEPGDRLGRRLVVWPDHRSGSLGSEQLDHAAAADVRAMLGSGTSGLLRYGRDGECQQDEVALFVTAYAPRPRMIVFGAIDFAAALTRMGAYLGYRVTACDARGVFATPHRFPDADEVVVDWPHRYLTAEAEADRIDDRTVICVLTHDAKFDVPLLEVALSLPVAYIGAMGSRRTHEDRVRRLRAAGVSEQALDRLAAPIGLDLGARTPEETAVSIAAEIIALARGGTGRRLSGQSGRIHQSEVLVG